MGKLSEGLICALIGVVGTVVGTIVGALLPAIQNGIGRKSVQVSNTQICLGSGSTDSDGYSDFSDVEFRLSVINRKGKDLILEKMYCELYTEEKLIQTLRCFDADTRHRSGGRIVSDELVYLDITGRSSRIVNVHSFSRKDLTSCDKVVFCYSWGICKRGVIVWEKSDDSVPYFCNT